MAEKDSHDGSFWFAVQTVWKYREGIPADPDRLVPAMKVYVHSEGTAPTYQKLREELQSEVEQLRKTVEQLEKKVKKLEAGSNSE